MKIAKLNLNNFMLFNELELNFSPGVNIICGDNSTGKTVLLKVLYAVLQSYCKISSDDSKKEIELAFAKKLQGVFRPDQNNIGRLVSRKKGSNRAGVRVGFEGGCEIAIDFANRSSKRANVSFSKMDMPRKETTQAVYLPPKEIISSMENFASLYEEYHIAFDETYYNLAKLLDRPLKRRANTAEENLVLEKFESIMSGKVTKKEKKFFLNVQGSGEFEMGLVSEGYRKLSTILYLILSGSLSKNSVLFWDEPETNMSPRMIRPIVAAVLELAKMGVQVFISTHDYFVQQKFNRAASYKSANTTQVDIQFISLFRNQD